MKVIGLCGGSGSGKGEASRVFVELGISVIDADSVYGELVRADSPCLRELVFAFGKGIISDSGSLDRAVMAELVFRGDGAEERRRLLNSITHRHVLREIRNRLDTLRDSGAECALVDAPLLFESGLDGDCDFTVAVIADRDKRISRICARDGIDRAHAERRIDSQISDDKLSSLADYVIYNNGALGDLRSEVINLVNKMKEV